MSRRVDAIVARVVELPRPLLVAFDVDGTLAPIVPRPEDASVPAETRAWLRKLAGLPKVEVALVTGRDARALAKILRAPQLWRAIEHGRRVLAPNEKPSRLALTPSQKKSLDAFRAWAEANVVPEGASLEEKEGALAVHVRDLEARDPKRAKASLRAARTTAARLGLLPRDGRAVLEAEVESGDKGKALEKLIRSTRARSVLYAGDDLTDLPAIRFAVEKGGEGIFVRSPERPRTPKGASAALASSDEVPLLLRALVEALAPSPRRR